MAITKIHAIKRTLTAALRYIENPEKTDGQLLISGYNVDPAMASVEFEVTTAMAKESRGDYSRTGRGNNLAYHLIQSFSPKDNITPEQAHDIGKQLADTLLGGKYEYVISTHIDKGHIHNHIIFNAVSFYDQRKFITKPYKTAAEIRAISDRLCAEHDLTVIKEAKKLGYSYAEWQARKTNTSWKSEIRKRLTFLLRMATSYEEFKNAATKIGLTIDDSGKHITYRLDGGNCVRGNKLSDNDAFIKTQIIYQIQKNAEAKEQIQTTIREAVLTAKNYTDFKARIKETGVLQKRKKSGEIIYQLTNSIENVQLSEAALGSAYSVAAIKQALREGKLQENIAVDIASEFNKISGSKVKDEECIAVKLKKENIDKVTADGIMLKLPGSGKLFIDNRHIDFDEISLCYTAWIRSRYDYYLADKNIEPDVPEADQLSEKSIKGENIIRYLQIQNGIQPEMIEVSSVVRTVGEKGISLSLPDERTVFVELPYVQLDESSGRCWVKIYPQWTYGTRSANKTEAIIGTQMIEQLKKNVPMTDSQRLTYKIRAAEQRNEIQNVQNLAHSLLLIRQEDISGVADLKVKLRLIEQKIAEIKVSVQMIQQKNVQYKQAAKFLTMVRENQEVKDEYEKCSILRKSKFERSHAGELSAYKYAVEELRKMDVRPNVDVDKVCCLIKSQEERIAEMNSAIAEEMVHYRELKGALEVVQQVQEKENIKLGKKEQENNKTL